jgi:DNA-binding GntR family transcriptional regulator
VVQLYEVRELLHREAALRIPLPASAEFIEHLASLHADYLHHAASGDFGAAHRANDEFHLALLSACGNSYLLGSIQHYMWLSLPVRAQRTAAAGHAQAAALDHAEMLRLLAGGDNEALAALCVSHVQAAKRDYMARGLTSAGAPTA